MRFAVTPDENGIVAVRHELGTEAVAVFGETSAGERVGIRAVVIIDRNEVEVSTVPGSGIAAVVVKPLSGLA